MQKTILLIAPDGERFDAYVCVPTGGGPGVMIIGGAAGLDAATRAHCERYADEGYVAIAPDLSRHFESGAQLQPHRRAAAIGDVYVTKSALTPYVGGNAKTGILGIGEGVAIAWRAALHGAVDACVVYGVKALEDEYRAAGSVGCPTAIHASMVDIAAAGVAISELRAEGAARPELRVYEYPQATSGFCEADDPLFDSHSASLAHSRSLGIFRPVLGPHFDFARLFQDHLHHEFVDHDPDATMATMVAAPYVNHVPTLTGGVGYDELKRFYRYHFIPKLPSDRESTLISETVGADTVVLELVNRFTHDREIDYFLPGIPPTGKRVEIPTVVVAKFRGGKLYHEHIYWDQASVLTQIGLLDRVGLPVAGAAQAQKMLDQRQPANELMKSWRTSEGKPI